MQSASKHTHIQAEAQSERCAAAQALCCCFQLRSLSLCCSRALFRSVRPAPLRRRALVALLLFNWQSFVVVAFVAVATGAVVVVGIQAYWLHVFVMQGCHCNREHRSRARRSILLPCPLCTHTQRHCIWVIYAKSVARICIGMSVRVCMCVGTCVYVNLFAAIRINSGHISTLYSTVLCHCASSLLKIITSHTQAASYLTHTHSNDHAEFFIVVVLLFLSFGLFWFSFRCSPCRRWLYECVYLRLYACVLALLEKCLSLRLPRASRIRSLSSDRNACNWQIYFAYEVCT